MRKLASIQKIVSIGPIAGADAIDVATINAWKVVVKKGEFNVGDLVIYMEVDSWVPSTLAPFLSKGKDPREYEGIKGERLRTVKLRGQVSQGLILPVHYADPGLGVIPFHYVEGQDVSEALGIVKYEPPVPACLAGVVKGPFPSAIPKTDEERIQNLTNEWPMLREYVYEVTEKLEGSSMTVFKIDSEFGVCSRNLNLKETEGNTLWALARRYDIEAKMVATNLDNFAISGEVIGESIQGNHYGIKGQDFYVFSIYDIAAGEYVSPNFRVALCKQLGLKHVPVIMERFLPAEAIELTLTRANGMSAINPNKLREGLVFKRIGGQEHWKAVSNNYLLKAD